MKERCKKIIISIVSVALSKIVILLFFIALIIYGAIYYQDHMINETKVSILNDANIIANQFDISIDNLEETAKIVSSLPEVRAKDKDNCNSILEQIYKDSPKYTIVLVADENGSSYCSSSKTAGVSIADRADFQKAVQTGRLAFGGFVIGKITGLPSASYGYPFYDENHQLIGVVGIGLSLNTIEKFTENIDSTKNNQVAIVDTNNILLSQYPKGSDSLTGTKWDDDIFTSSLSNMGKTVKLESQNGFSKVKAFAVTKDGGAIIIVSSPVETTLLFSRDLFLKLFSSILLLYFAVIIIAVLLKLQYKIRIKKQRKKEK